MDAVVNGIQKQIKWALGLMLLGCFFVGLTSDKTPQLDARFVQAFTRLNNTLISKEGMETMTIETINGQFAVYQDNQQITVIKDTDFYNLHLALRQVVAYLLEQQDTTIKQVINSDFSNQSLRINQLIQQIKDFQLTTDSDNKTLKKATDALIILGFFMDDQVDKMQALKANAWASLALWEVKTSTRDDTLEMMLAQSLGYEVYARHVASKLKNNAVYAYYDDEISEIPSSPFLNLVLVKRSSYNHNAEKWLENVNQLATAEVSASLIFANVSSVDSFDVRSKLLLIYPLILAADYLQSTEDSKSVLFRDNQLALNIENISEVSQFFLQEISYQPRFLLSEFETAVKSETISSADLFDEQVVVNFWQDQMFNAYYNIGVYLTQVEKGSSLANNLQLVLQSNTHSDNGRLLYAWFQSLNAENSYNTTANQLTKLATDERVPVLLLKRLNDWMYELRPSLTKEYLAASALITKRLDSRYSHRLIDLQLQARQTPQTTAENLDLSSYRYSVNTQLLEALDAMGDLTLLHTVYKKALQPEDQARIIQLIFKHGGGSTSELANLETLYQNSDNTFSLLRYYVDVLLQYTNETETAMQAMDDWIIKRRDLSRQDYLDLIALIAKARLKAGQVDKAWQAISPTLSFNYPSTMLVAADILLEQEKIEQTNEMIANYRRHYPNTLESLSYQLKSLWLQEKPEVAADLVTYWHYPLTDKQFYDFVVTPIQQVKGDDALKNRFIDTLKQSGLPENRLVWLSSVN